MGTNMSAARPPEGAKALSGGGGPREAGERRGAVTARRWVFWAALAGFVAWDFAASAPVNLRLEPPFIAAGSGTPGSGGHCAMPR